MSIEYNQFLHPWLLLKEQGGKIVALTNCRTYQDADGRLRVLRREAPGDYAITYICPPVPAKTEIVAEQLSTQKGDSE